MDEHDSRAAGQQSLPGDLQQVALVDADTSGGTGGMSASWWKEKVRSGEAPAPAFRAPKCTRWYLTDVRKFWIDYAQRRAQDTAAADVLLKRNRRATAAATASKAKRDASAGVPA